MNPTSSKREHPAKPADEQQRQLIRWLWRLPVIVTVVGGGLAARRAYQVHSGKHHPATTPAFDTLEPLRIAPLAAFGADWEVVAFTAGAVPAIALHLPAPVAGGLSSEDRHDGAFSRICTHLGCVVSLSRDVEATALAFNDRGRTLALVCPCPLGIFLPAKAGRAVSGPAVKPLPRIRLSRQGDLFYATGMERPPSP